MFVPARLLSMLFSIQPTLYHALAAICRKMQKTV
jgi:hypothetical protein